jgi:hypothetical protein
MFFLPSPGRPSWSAARRPPAWLLVAAAAAILVCLDPWLGTLVPRRWWPELAADFPYKLTALVLLGAVLAYAAARAVSGHAPEQVALVLIAAGAQLGGLKAGIIAPLDVVTAGVILALAARSLADPASDLRVSFVVAAGAALVVLALPHLAHANPVRYVVGVLALAKVVLLALALVNLVTRGPQLRLLVTSLIVIGAASALLGVSQALLYRYTGESFSFIDDFSGGEDTEIKDTLIGRTLRASALNATAQHLATFLVLLLPFVLYRLTEPGGRRGRYALVAVAFAAGVVLTWNYVSIAALGLVLLAFPLARWPRRVPHFAALAALALVALYYLGVLDWVYGMLFEGHGSVSKGLMQRGVLLELALEKVARDPLIGEGLREFAYYPGNYWHRPAHNAFFQAATELGLPGALVLVALLAMLLTQLAGAARRALALAAPCLLSLGAMLVLMLGEPMLDHSNTWLFFALYQCVLLVPQAPRSTSPMQRKPCAIPA